MQRFSNKSQKAIKIQSRKFSSGNFSGPQRILQWTLNYNLNYIKMTSLNLSLFSQSHFNRSSKSSFPDKNPIVLERLWISFIVYLNILMVLIQLPDIKIIKLNLSIRYTSVISCIHELRFSRPPFYESFLIKPSPRLGNNVIYCTKWKCPSHVHRDLINWERSWVIERIWTCRTVFLLKYYRHFCYWRSR